MRIKFPKDDSRFSWTAHIKNKMLYYGLSEQRIRRVLKSPTRVEEGIAPNTIAAMQSNKTRKNPEEIWTMYQVLPEQKTKKLMISVWRYPGITKPGSPIPIPDDILKELDTLV